MKALVLIPGTTTLQLVDRAEPTVIHPDEVKLQVLQVGICGTDREQAAGGRALLPEGQSDLVIGHEMFGQVVAVGAEVTRVQPGDYAVFTVRRGCSLCLPCRMDRADMCRSGKYHERGIWGLDGYQVQYAVDRQQHVVRVPPEVATCGVLAEPLSVVEKAIDETVRIQQARLPDAQATPWWLFGRRCLVAGLGPIGLLAAMVLRLRGAEVYGLDIADPQNARVQWLNSIGGQYIDSRHVATDTIDDTIGEMDLIVEAAGVTSLAFNLIDALAMNGAYVLTGIPGAERPFEFSGAELMRQLVLDNQVMVGSVNAARDHFQMAVEDLQSAQRCWGDLLGQLITQKVPYTDFTAALTRRSKDDIKVIIEWAA